MRVERCESNAISIYLLLACGVRTASTNIGNVECQKLSANNRTMRHSDIKNSKQQPNLREQKSNKINRFEPRLLCPRVSLASSLFTIFCKKMSFFQFPLDRQMRIEEMKGEKRHCISSPLAFYFVIFVVGRRSPPIYNFISTSISSRYDSNSEFHLFRFSKLVACACDWLSVCCIRLLKLRYVAADVARIILLASTCGDSAAAFFPFLKFIHEIGNSVHKCAMRRCGVACAAEGKKRAAVDSPRRRIWQHSTPRAIIVANDNARNNEISFGIHLSPKYPYYA